MNCETKQDFKTDWEKFKVIHGERPHIYNKFKGITKQLMGRGYNHYSAYGIMHIVRFQVWEKGVTMKPEEEFKVSNNMTPFYARVPGRMDKRYSILKKVPGSRKVYFNKPSRRKVRSMPGMNYRRSL